MNILIINPPSKDLTINRDMAGGLGYSAGEGIVLPPIDLLNMATSLKKNNRIRLIDAIAERINNYQYFLDIIKKEKIGLVILGLSLPTLDEDCLFAKKLRNGNKNLKIFIKTGIKYKEILERALIQSGADKVIFGECDLNIEEYIQGGRKSACVAWVAGKVKYFPMKGDDRISNLDKLPIPERGMLKLGLYKYGLLSGRVTTMMTSLGCPFPCGYFCPHPLVQGKIWRGMSAERVIKELISIKNDGIDNVFFRDAVFTYDMERTKKICRLMIEKKIKLNWWCETRINVLNEDVLKLMKKAGCKGINVGVETLDQELIISEGKPGVSLEAVRNIRKTAHEIGIKLHFLMIIGLPDENLRTINNSFKYLIEIKPDSIGFSTITPYPGTELFEKSKKDGLITNFDWSKYNGSFSNMKTKYLSKNDMKLARLFLMSTSYALRKESILSKYIIRFNGISLKLWQYLRRE